MPKKKTIDRDLDDATSELLSKVQKLPKKKLITFISTQATELEKNGIIINELKNDNNSLQRDYDDLAKDFKKLRAELSQARTELNKPVVLTRTIDKDTKEEVKRTLEATDEDKILEEFIKNGTFKKWTETSPIVSRDID